MSSTPTTKNARECLEGVGVKEVHSITTLNNPVNIIAFLHEI